MKNEESRIVEEEGKANVDVMVDLLNVKLNRRKFLDIVSDKMSLQSKETTPFYNQEMTKTR